MNEVAVVLIGALVVLCAVTIIVGGARSRVGTAGQRVGAIFGGALLLAFGLLWMIFGLPRVNVPFLVPGATVGAVILGWIIGYSWGESRRGQTH
jgi:hypothetical protein